MTKLGLGPKLRVGEFQLTFVETTRVELYRFRAVTVVTARKEPSALLVEHEQRTYGLGMDGAPLSPEESRRFAEYLQEGEA